MVWPGRHVDALILIVPVEVQASCTTSHGGFPVVEPCRGSRLDQAAHQFGPAVRQGGFGSYDWGHVVRRPISSVSAQDEGRSRVGSCARGHRREVRERWRKSCSRRTSVLRHTCRRQTGYCGDARCVRAARYGRRDPTRSASTRRPRARPLAHGSRSRPIRASRDGAAAPVGSFCATVPERSSGACSRAPARLCDRPDARRRGQGGPRELRRLGDARRPREPEAQGAAPGAARRARACTHD